MIVFDLKCGKDHLFETWFRDNATFDAQAKAGEVVCPVCGNTKVVKAPMAPNIATSKDRGGDETAKAAAAMKMLRKLRTEIEKNSDYVGPNFAQEALKIHHGETEKRNIHGEATSGEESALRDEGVAFQTIPWIPRTDS